MCSSSATAAAGDLRFLPLLFVVLAIAARLAPERLCGDVRSRRLTSQRYYWSCKCLYLSLCFPLFTAGNSTSVASCGCRYPAQLFGDDLDPALSRWTWCCEQSRAYNSFSLQSARFLTFDRRITECWSQLGAAVSTAQSLGLHRDASVMVGWYFADMWTPLTVCSALTVNKPSTGAEYGLIYTMQTIHTL